MARTSNSNLMDESTALRWYTALCGDNAGSHNAIYRGKYLGNALTAAQSEAIRAGTFANIFVGDYWTIGGVNFRVAHCDYWLGTGDTTCTTHHVVVVPDTSLYAAPMNSTNTTDGGYAGSTMYKTGLAQAKELITAAFGADHILTHRESLCNAVASGRPSSLAWYDSAVELMNENMVYGSHIFAPVSDGSTIPLNGTVDAEMLMLFHVRPDLIRSPKTAYWLRDVIRTTHFANVAADGRAQCDYATKEYGVRPVVAVY